MPIETSDQFIAVVKYYLKTSNKSVHEFAQQVGVPRVRVSDWFRRGLKDPNKRQEFIGKYPDIFSDENLINAERDLKECPGDKVQEEPKIMEERVRILILIEMCRDKILTLYPKLLDILKTNPETRELFRVSLGDDWKKFLEINRALTGEKALQIAIEEGRIDVNNSH